MSNSNWTLHIGSTRSILSLPFREIYRYRDLLYLFVKRDFIAFYKQTLLGPLWFVIQPVFTTIIFFPFRSAKSKISPLISVTLNWKILFSIAMLFWAIRGKHNRLSAPQSKMVRFIIFFWKIHNEFHFSE